MKKIFSYLSTLLIFLSQASPSTNANIIPVLEFSEVSFKNSVQDYIKIQVNRAPQSTIQINDDKTIIEISPSQITTQKEIIVLFKSATDEIIESANTLEVSTTKKGLTATTEQLTITSDNEIISYVCWQNSAIAQSEEKDIQELKEKIPDLQCLNSEEIKNQGVIKKTQNTWSILNPEKKKKNKSAKPKSSTKKNSASSNKANQESAKVISEISNLQIKTENLSPQSPTTNHREILIAAITIIISLSIALLTKSKPKSQT